MHAIQQASKSISKVIKTIDDNWNFTLEDNVKSFQDFNSDDFNKLTKFYQGSEDNYKKFVLYNNSAIGGVIYSLAKIEYGMCAGYRLTDLTYAGDLISNVGDPLTSILDKIVQMLGDFEYFYDTDGRFIFQRKKTYINQSWNQISTSSDNQTFIDTNSTPYAYEFEGNSLVTSFSNNPNLGTVKNDFSIWGMRKSVAGAEIPIHLRYAIDHKPTSYTSFAISADEAAEYNEIFKPKKELLPREKVKYEASE